MLMVPLLDAARALRASMAPSGTAGMAPWTSTAQRTIEGQDVPSSGHVGKRSHSVADVVARVLVLVRPWHSAAEAVMGSQRQSQLAMTLVRAT